MKVTRKAVFCLVGGSLALMVGLLYQDDWPWPQRVSVMLIAFGATLIVSGIAESLAMIRRHES